MEGVKPPERLQRPRPLGDVATPRSNSEYQLVVIGNADSAERACLVAAALIGHDGEHFVAQPAVVAASPGVRADHDVPPSLLSDYPSLFLVNAHDTIFTAL